MSSQDIFVEGSDESESQSVSGSGTPVQSQPLPEVLGSQETLDDSPESPIGGNLHCHRCKKTLKTARGFQVHQALHIQKDSQQKVSHELLISVASEVAERVLQSLTSDPLVGAFGSMRGDYYSALLCKTQEEQWAKFVLEISTPFLDILLDRTKVVPLKQHEDNLVKLNYWLNCNISKVTASLREVCDGADALLNNVAFRFCTKYFDGLQVQCVKLMRVKEGCPSFASVPELNSDEKQSLYYAAGSIVRAFIWKAKTNGINHPVWKERLVCINDRFLYNESDNYHEEFYKMKNWFDCVNRGGLVAINESLFTFFLCIEKLVRSIFVGSDIINHELVFERVFSLNNEEILNSWHILVSGYLSENKSIDFLALTIKRYVQFSGRAEAGLRRRQEQGKKSYQSVALRTDLKRN